MMPNNAYVVLAQWDSEHKVWFVKTSDIPGLMVEAETLEEFQDIVIDVAGELIDAAESADNLSGDIPICFKAESVASISRMVA